MAGNLGLKKLPSKWPRTALNTSTHAQSLFLFPIVFGINLIQFFDGKKNRTGQDLIFCLGFSITRRAARAI